MLYLNRQKEREKNIDQIIIIHNCVYTPDIHCGDITSIGKSKFHAKSTCWHSPFAIFSLYLPGSPVKGGQGHTGNLLDRQLSVKRKEQPIGFDALIKND